VHPVLPPSNIWWNKSKGQHPFLLLRKLFNKILHPAPRRWMIWLLRQRLFYFYIFATHHLSLYRLLQSKGLNWLNQNSNERQYQNWFYNILFFTDHYWAWIINLRMIISSTGAAVMLRLKHWKTAPKMLRRKRTQFDGHNKLEDT
jgi:hypothetical protein